MLVLDSVAENFTPQQIVSDMQAVQAKAIGLYVFNNDVEDPGAVVKDAAFVQELERIYGGPCVLPIITIAGDTAPEPHYLVDDVRGWFPTDRRRVSHDLERTAFPSVDEVTALYQAEKAAGLSPGTYGVASTQDTYAPAQPEWKWGVWNYTEGFGYLPQGYAMWQYTDQLLAGKYDGSTADDGFSVVVADPPPEEDSMQQLLLLIRQPSNGAIHVLDLVRGFMRYISEDSDAVGGEAAGLPTWEVTDEFFNKLASDYPVRA